MPEIEPPYGLIARALDRGEVVPFFGSAASAICRPEGETKWGFRKPFYPFGAELADELAREASYYGRAEAGQDSAVNELLDAAAKVVPGVERDKLKTAFEPVIRKHVGMPPLALIASFVAHVQSTREDLDQELRETFSVKTKPGDLQTTLATIPTIKLYVTTNYDDLIETALADVNRRPNVLVDRSDKGLLFYKQGDAPEPAGPSDLDRLLGDGPKGLPETPIVFKLHGSIDRKNSENDSYLITEEDYVDFLGRSWGYIPEYIEQRLMAGKKLLFLGYSLEDWNVRVILSKLLNPRLERRKDRAQLLFDADNRDRRFWAIVRGRSDAEQRVWQAKNLNIYPMDLREFTDKLVAALHERRT
ncbi:MAG TPA: SIR2 family protein [Roseiarcus sp.]|nr:SIR2 family protein [Roseiarcus sp.]